MPKNICGNAYSTKHSLTVSMDDSKIFLVDSVMGVSQHDSAMGVECREPKVAYNYFTVCSTYENYVVELNVSTSTC